MTMKTIKQDYGRASVFYKFTSYPSTENEKIILANNCAKNVANVLGLNGIGWSQNAIASFLIIAQIQSGCNISSFELKFTKNY